jgi:RecA-family ATPase
VPVPSRRFIVRDMIPDQTVTIVSGDGGVGKSLLLIQLAIASATGGEWIGTLPERGPVVFVSAEDDLDELHRRIANVAEAQHIDLGDLGDLHIVPLAGRDAVMGAPEGKTGIIKETPVWRGLVSIVKQTSPRLVILDTLADVFAGNEIARQEARQFIGILPGPAIEHSLAVVLLAHPSLSGMASGSGTNGSTAWSNSVRSRLYLETIKGDDGREIDADLRVLRTKKANYGPSGSEVRLRWSNGCFVRETPAGGFDKVMADAKAERVLLDLLASHLSQDRDVSPKQSNAYAPSVFEKHPKAEGVTKRAFAAAMESLLAANRIAVETIGPPSRRSSRLVIVPRKEGEP